MSQKLISRQKELKGIYKQYNDLPLNIVKQIIDYKSNKPHSVSKYIELEKHKVYMPKSRNINNDK